MNSKSNKLNYIKSKHVVSLIMLCGMMFLISHFNGNHWLANTSRALIVPLFTVLYFVNNTKISPFFTLFLFCYSISDLISIVGYSIRLDWEYYIGNALYIVAYLALSYEILLSINMKHILKHFKIHVIVLVVVNVYVNYVLLKFQPDNFSTTDLAMELLYNIATVILVSISLLNYFYRDDNKALILFMGSLSIAVSEVIQIAYYYILDSSDSNVLVVSYSLFLILGFYFYYIQSKLEYEEVLVIA